MKLIKWGIIGCGDVTEYKSGPAYQKVNGFCLHGVMRRDIQKAADYARRHNVPLYFNDADELINNSEIDAVYIATPPDSHAFYALKVAASGKPCCIEKPMAPSYKECVLIEKAFLSKNLPLFVAYYRRSLPRFLKIKEWIDNGKIGNVRHINYRYLRSASLQDKSDNYNWRTDKKIAYGGYFDDLASHALDLFVFLLGNVKKAKGMSMNQQGLYSAMDAVVGSWIYESGVTGSGTWNFGANEMQDKVEIIGDMGVICFSVFTEESVKLKVNDIITSVFIKNPNPIQLPHVDNIRKELLDGVAHPSSGVSGVHTSWIMESILNNL
jgi:1,5-anhydro-D-fructose reductase (1,5-anhydro-D-mannitol-forming)